jgi:hypothetical protein
MHVIWKQAPTQRRQSIYPALQTRYILKPIKPTAFALPRFRCPAQLCRSREKGPGAAIRGLRNDLSKI